jgi:metal-responsive CopG/Arc/MetJ family transcriptional regulator
MKAIQVLIDEKLLELLDQDEEVRRSGRSAVLRRAAIEYLKKKRSRKIADDYRRAYSGTSGLDSEFEGWAEEGKWPEP